MTRPKLVIYTDDYDAHTGIVDQFPQVDTRITLEEEEFRQSARDAEIVFTNRRYDRRMLLGLPALKWLHISGTGIDRLQPVSEFDSSITITNTRGMNAAMMADYVMCTLLMLVWDFPRLLRNQAERRWERWRADRLEGKTLLIVGLGSVGRELSVRAAAAGLRTIGIRHTPEPIVGVERVVRPERLCDVLGEADYVVLSLPLLPTTRGLFGAREFDRMKPTAYLVNVSRGAIVDEAAFLEALRQHKIAGAALDVFEQEPLPPESELWTLENVILTPHVSAASTDFRTRVVQVFCSNLERYLAGKPLLHVIDRNKQY